MALAKSSIDWLPDHQLRVVESLAIVNDAIDEAGEVLLDYTRTGALWAKHKHRSSLAGEPCELALNLL